MSPTKTYNKKLGFTLVEVMVALMIISVVIMTLANSEIIAIKSSRKTSLLTKASLLSKQMMAEIEVMNDLQGFAYLEKLEKKEESGFEEEDLKGWKWAREIKEVEFPIGQIMNIFMSVNKDQEGETAESTTQEQNSGMMGLMSNNIEKLMKEALREVSLTVFWPIKGGKDFGSLTVVYYAVDFKMVDAFQFAM